MNSHRLLLIGFALLLGMTQADAADWPQFLGPNRNGISQETGLIDVWPENGLPEVWRTKGGAGMAGMVVSDGKLVTVIQDAGKQSVIALDAKTGEPLWSQAVAPAYSNGMGDGPRAAPAVEQGSVYVFTGDGVLASLELASGTVNWSTNLVTDLQGRVAEYGLACSPLVVGDLVIVTAQTSKGTILAFNKVSGKLAWGNGAGAPGYSSPALLDLDGQQQVVAFTSVGALGLDPESGRVHWQYPYKTDYDCNIATPIAVGSNVFISAGENHGCELLSVPTTSVREVEPVWSSHGSKSVLRNEWQTSVLLDGKLYGFDNVGSAGPVTHLTCLDATTGKRLWQQLRFGKGNLIAADGKLFCSTMKGELVVVGADPESYAEWGRTRVVSTTRQAPVLANGLLYLRDEKEIVCLDVRKQ